jgi:cob(I)alamin adenosyltransferase
MPSGYHPIVSYEEDLKKMTSIVGAISSVDEANEALENTFKRSGKKNPTQANESLESIKNRIIEGEEKLLLDRHEKQKKQYFQRQRSMRFESIRYVIYSFIFIIFYFNLTLFFNRLHKSS